MKDNVKKGLLSIGIIGGAFAFLMSIDNKKSKEVVIKTMPKSNEPSIVPMYAITNKKVSVYSEISNDTGILYLKGELTTYAPGTYIGLVVEILNGFVKLKRQINGTFYYCYVDQSAITLSANANDGILPNVGQTKILINALLNN